MGPVCTWYKMKKLLRGHFLPPDYEQHLFSQFQDQRQGQRSVHEYTAEFMRLFERNNLTESEGQQVSRYLDGLKPAVPYGIGVQVILTLSEAKRLDVQSTTVY